MIVTGGAASFHSVKFIERLSRADWNPWSSGGPRWSSFKQGGSGHQDGSSSTSQSLASMTSSQHSHEISIKSRHLAKDKTIWWCELGCVWVTITLMRSSVCKWIPEHDIGGLFLWNYINLLYRFNTLPPSLSIHQHSPLMPISTTGANCYRKVLSARHDRYW